MLSLSGTGKAFDLTKGEEVRHILGLPEYHCIDVIDNGKIIAWEDERYVTSRDFDREKAINELDSCLIRKTSSHYEWLELNLDEFWVNVFGKNLNDSYNAGIISAHGDKAYGYRREWEEAGVPFNHGVALYLLTYTKELGDTPKWESGQWVIDNYEKYRPLLNEDY